MNRKEMRRSLTILVALAVPLMLASCSATEDGAASAATPSPVETVTETATPTPTSEPETVESVYLAQVREAHGSLVTAPDNNLVGIGEDICDMYDLGRITPEVDNFLAMNAGVDYTQQELDSMHGAAVAAFCPEHLGVWEGSTSNG